MPLQVIVGGNTRGFEMAMARAQAVANVTSQEIARRFEDSSGKIAAAFGKRLIAPAAAIAGFIALKAAIDAVTEAVQEQMRAIIELADKASDVGVGAGFFQSFLTGAREMKVSAESLEKALSNAFRVLRDEVDPNWTVFDTGKQKINDVTKALLEARELFTTMQGFTGLDLFRSATNQEERIRAVLISARELERIGERLVALDLIERTFGAEMADNIRKGKTSVDELIAALERAPKFTQELVEQTKEVDRQLRAARDTLQRSMTPAWEGIIERVNAVKSAATDLVNTLARGLDVLGSWQKLLSDPRFFIPGLSGFAVQDFLFRQQREATAGRGIGGEAARDAAAAAAGAGAGAAAPFPRRRPLDAPGPRAETGGGATTRDAFEREEERIRRRIAAMDAETSTLGLNAEARERVRITTQLLQRAEEAGITVNDALRERVRLLAEQYAQAAQRAEQARTVMELTREFGSAVAEAFEAAVIQGEKLDKVLKNLVQRLTSRAMNRAFDALFTAIGGSLASSLFGLGQYGGGGIGDQGPTLAMLGRRQHGGPVTAGQPYVVGERGPELFVPRVSGTVVAGGGTPGVAINYAPVIDARGADMAAIARLEMVMQEQQRLLPSRVVAYVNEARRRSVKV